MPDPLESTHGQPDDDALERVQIALARFLFPGYCVPRSEMARAVLEAVAGDDWLAKMPARHAVVGESDEVERLRAENERLREALTEIAETGCLCAGYYRCNGCEKIGAELAEAALGGSQAKGSE